MKNVYQMLTIPMFFVITTSCFTQTIMNGENEKKIKDPILYNVEVVFEADILEIFCCVHLTLAKSVTWYDKERKDFVPFQEMVFKQLLLLTKSWYENGSRINSKPHKDIEIFEINEKTASAKVITTWGMDSFYSN